MAFILAVDYDGTLFEGSYPATGEPKQDIIDKVKEFKDNDNCEVVLWTCREGKSLDEALERCKEEGLEFDAVNENAPANYEWLEEANLRGEKLCERKIFAHFYVDDRALNLDIFLRLDVEKICESHK